MRQLALIAHNLRSCHNVGSLLRTADGLGVEMVYLTGYTPYPKKGDDDRLPHLAQKNDRQIHKTALGAEHSVNWQHQSDIETVLEKLRAAGFKIVALEQAPQAENLETFRPPSKVALIVGREVSGIEPETLKQSDIIIQIPMRGQKESFNVAEAAAMAMYQLLVAP
jgi:tRNA G18 (ribose-2'-O)-methylase SpoU